MKKSLRYLLPLAALVLLCASVALAQTDEQEYVGHFNLFAQIIQSIIWSAIYLLFYAAALLIPLASLRLFDGFEAEMLLWIGATWAGGMAANVVAYHFTHQHLLAALIAVPIIFAWSVFIGTRSFVDLLWQDAMRIALVVALVCAPWFGPTWRVENHAKPAPVEEGYRMSAPRVAMLGTLTLPTWPVER